jgi:precorrin-2 dehydrogenase / sirohydrochlorin ferrochelatase
MTMSALFPMFMKLAGKRCLVVGAGKIGEPKISSLLDTGASVHVIALAASEAVHDWAKAGKISLELRAFSAEDLHETFLAIVATASRSLNGSIYPEYCDFYYPALVRRGDLQIAISTNGQSPSLSQRLRQQLERQFGPAYAPWVAELGETRKHVLASNLDPRRKRDLLHSLASREALDAALAEHASTMPSPTNQPTENERRETV